MTRLSVLTPEMYAKLHLISPEQRAELFACYNRFGMRRCMALAEAMGFSGKYVVKKLVYKHRVRVRPNPRRVYNPRRYDQPRLLREAALWKRAAMVGHVVA